MPGCGGPGDEEGDVFEKMIIRGAVLGLAIGAVGCDDGDTEPGTDAGVSAVSMTVWSGGQLYDNVWSGTGDDPSAAGDHPLWADRPDPDSNTRTGADTWRCKECHGWDYAGVDGAYGSGSHRTGIAGIRGTAMGRDEIYAMLTADAPEGHGYGALLDDEARYALADFVLEGQLDAGAYIGGDGTFTGDAAAGESLYTVGVPDGRELFCSSCHGADGLTTPPGADAGFEDWVGYIANDNPAEFLHKIRFGQPGTAMRGYYLDGLAPSGYGDLGAYAQGLPEAP